MLFGISIFSQITLSKDLSYVNNGVATFSYPTEMSAINFQKIFVNNDSSLNICLGTDGTDHTGMIAKLNADGLLDPFYNNTGKIILSANPHTAFEFAKQDDKIVAIYSTDYQSTDSGAKMVRYDSAGNIDETFGVNGLLEARPDLYRQQVMFQSNGIYHLWGKITGYRTNGMLNSHYGNQGEHDPVINGVPHDYMELYSFFGNNDGKNFVNKYHYEIAVSGENSPHNFTSYSLMENDFYNIPGASSGVSIFPKKFNLTNDGNIGYLFGIDPNSGNERNRFVVLNSSMQPQNFNGKEFIDLGEANAATEINDLVLYNNHYLFVGKKNNKPILFSYNIDGNVSQINGLEEFYENFSGDEFSQIVVNGDDVYVLGKKSATHEVSIIKYQAQILATSTSQQKTTTILNPFRDELKILNADKIQSVKIYDMSGKLLKSDNKSTVITTDLPKGNYLVKIDFSDRKSQTFKAIKN